MEIPARADVRAAGSNEAAKLQRDKAVSSGQTDLRCFQWVIGLPSMLSGSRSGYLHILAPRGEALQQSRHPP
jgi:hypothetical protein